MPHQGLEVLPLPLCEVASFTTSFTSVTLQYLGQTPSARVVGVGSVLGVHLLHRTLPTGQGSREEGSKAAYTMIYSSHFTKTLSNGVLSNGAHNNLDQ